MSVLWSFLKELQLWRQQLRDSNLQQVRTLRKRLKRRHRLVKAIALLLATLVLIGALGQRFYNQPELKVDRPSTDTIRAPRDAQIPFPEATKANREEARKRASSVWQLDATANEQIQQELRTLLSKGTLLRQQIGTLPSTDPNILTAPTLLFLRQAPEFDINVILAAVQDPKAPLPADATQQTAIAELRRYRNTAFETYPVFLAQLSHARMQYEQVRTSLQDPDTQTIFDSRFLDLPDPVWEKTQAEILNAGDRILTQGIPPGLPPSQIVRAVELQSQVTMPSETKAIAAKILLKAIKPNLSQDPDQTKIHAEAEAQKVPEVYIKAEEGKVIVRTGEIITQERFLLLDHFGLSRRSTNWRGFVLFGILVSAAVGMFWQIEQRLSIKNFRTRDYALVWLMLLSAPVLDAFNVPFPNLPAIGLLISSFYSPLLAVTSVGLLGIVLPIGTEILLRQWLPAVAAGLVCAIAAGRLRSREELAFLGIATGVTQGALYLLIRATTGDGWYPLIGEAVVYGAVGLAWNIFAIGISPYLEHIFDLVTTTRLVELSNPNRPLLKRLASETPGTFQHTLFVANLAEAAARELHCNVELTRAGTLYHDIGKMHDPMGFIENQMGGPNKHDLINDPWVSVAIIKKHVTEGILMARKARLPKAVQAFIPEHQGTMTIAYFYHQAQQQVAEDRTKILNDADFRYDGPPPQSRETGIVMLADASEAALRSLHNATPETALNMINKILAARWKDGQLDESGLTREEMSKIAQVFVQVWQQSNHQRIAYPKLGGK
jgi:cyclic-di-AMP phosphodiesterase PgpH